MATDDLVMATANDAEAVAPPLLEAPAADSSGPAVLGHLAVECEPATDGSGTQHGDRRPLATERQTLTRSVTTAGESIPLGEHLTFDALLPMPM